MGNLHAFTFETSLTVNTGAYSVQLSKLYSQSGTTMYYITPQGSGAVDIKVKVPSSAPTLYFFTVPNMVNQATATPINNVPVVDDGTYKTYTVTVNNLNLLITYKYNSSVYYGYSPTSVTKIGGSWIDADCYKIPVTPQLVNTNETRSINRHGSYSGGTWHITYSLAWDYATSDTLKYLPSSTSQQVVKILVPNTANPWFFYGTVSGATLTPQGDCSWTTETIDNKTLYTVTIPANKVCFVTKYLTGSQGSTSSNYYYEGFVPDDISVDNDWVIGALHKFNGTSWD